MRLEVRVPDALPMKVGDSVWIETRSPRRDANGDLSIANANGHVVSIDRDRDDNIRPVPHRVVGEPFDWKYLLKLIAVAAIGLALLVALAEALKGLR